MITLLNGIEICYSTATMLKKEGRYYMDCLIAEKDYIEFEAMLSDDGYYSLVIEHASDGDSYHNILIDGAYYGGVLCKSAKGHTVTKTCPIYLENGLHKLRLLRNWGELCFFAMYPEFIKGEKEVHMPKFELSNPNASKECRDLIDYFRSIYGKRIITGQHTDFNRADIAYIKQRTGQTPAMAGFDVMSYSGSTYTDEMKWETIRGLSGCKRNIDAAIEWAVESRGLVTLCWHWYSPSKGRDKSFYTANTDFDLAQALDEKAEDYKLILRDLDLIAEQLKRLRDKDISVLWRPLHEADGGWFWWGAKGAKAFKELYRLMYDRFTVMHGLNNLIWVLTAPTEDWYPGDDVVDLNTIDVYAPEANPGPLCLEYEKVRGVRNNKPVGLGEIGTVPDLYTIMKESPWLWFMIWYGFSYEEQHNKPENLRKFMNAPAALNLEEFAAR